MNNNVVSCMLVTYNRLELTKRMMENFIQSTDADYRLIIVDNGSTDGTVKWLKELKPASAFCQGVDVQLNEKNMGIAIGRNQGLLIADKYKDKWLCTLDNDMELPNGWLTECLSIIKTNHKFVIGVNMEGINYPIQIMNGKPIQWKKEGNLGTVCTVFHRKLFEAIGFFTTEYKTRYGTEDANYFFRARIAGWQMGYLPTNGVHFGQGELDTGEYREFKNKCHKDNLSQFQQDCRNYMNGKKSIYHYYE